MGVFEELARELIKYLRRPKWVGLSVDSKGVLIALREDGDVMRLVEAYWEIPSELQKKLGRSHNLVYEWVPGPRLPKIANDVDDDPDDEDEL